MARTDPVHLQGSVTGTAVVIDAREILAPTITLIPGSGNTAKVEYSTTPMASVDPANAVWQDWPGGTVSATTTSVFAGRLAALRFTRVSGSSTVKYEVLA